VVAEKREKVMAAAHALGVRPSERWHRRRQPSPRKQRVIGVVARDLSDTFFTFLAGAVIKEARKADLQVLLGDADSRALQARALEDILGTRQCESIILLGDVEDADLLADLQQTNLPVLGLCGGDRTKKTRPGRRGLDVPFLNSDNREGVFELFRQLTARRHERIAFVQGPWDADVLARGAAYVECMKKRGLSIRDGYLQTVPNSAAGGVLAMSRLLELDAPPTAVIAGTDNLAIGCIQAAWNMNCNVPSDISITGFDGLPISAFVWPSLATMRQEVEEIAYQGLKLLERAAAGQPIPCNLQPVQTRFVPGASIGPVRG
jgi:DNA-binding LacI/PurR family transcriptional regulator